MQKKAHLFRIIIFISSLFFCISTASSESAFELSPYSKLSFGSLKEYIFVSEENQKDSKISLLEWQEMPLLQVGLMTEGIFNLFHLKADFSYAIPVECGSMYDSDFLMLNDVKTNYSIHENTAALCFDAKISLEYDFYLQKDFAISPIVQAHYSHRFFEARNGYGWYGDNIPWYDDSAHYYPDGTFVLAGIDYKRQTLYTFAGFVLKILSIKDAQINLAFMLSPYTYSYADDCHYLNKKMTESKHFVYYNNIFLERFQTQMDFSYRFSKHCSYFLGASFLFGSCHKGDLYTDTWTEKPTLIEDQPGGVSEATFSFYTGCKIRFSSIK